MVWDASVKIISMNKINSIKEKMDWTDIYTADELKELHLSLEKEATAERIQKEHFRSELKKLINTRILWNWLNEHDHWDAIGIFSLKITTERNHYYGKDMPHAKVIGEDYPKMHHQRESTSEVGANHIFIYQSSSYPCEDCYSGYIAFPLKNRKYFLVSFSC
jgi:hypothetical protein